MHFCLNSARPVSGTVHSCTIQSEDCHLEANETFPPCGPNNRATWDHLSFPQGTVPQDESPSPSDGAHISDENLHGCDLPSVVAIKPHGLDIEGRPLRVLRVGVLAWAARDIEAPSASRIPTLCSGTIGHSMPTSVLPTR
jgi:hypothetical protein